jgi:CheY-like chemotaxis protein
MKMDKVKKHSVLIIDDENSNIMMLSFMLNHDYKVYAVKNGSDGIKAAKKFIPDIILLDIMMPEMDGYTVLEELKKCEETRDIPVIFITMLNLENNEEKGLALGAVDYITKPFYHSIVKLRIQNQIKIVEQMRVIIEKESAAKANEAKIEFLSKMSHNMLTPMNAITGFTEIAQMADNPSQTVMCLKEIDKSSKELLMLLKDLLGISA